MEFHEAANIFPLMNWNDYQGLKSDIAENGLRQAITVYEGKIIDGRHRYRACIELGIEPKFRQWDETGSLLAFVVSMNLHRRHLTASQRAIVASEIKPLFEKEARNRQGRRTDLGAKLHGCDKGKASEQAAKLVNVSTRSVESANKLRRGGVPELVNAVRKGEVPVSMAAKVAGLPHIEQLKIVKIGDKREMREAIKSLPQMSIQQNKLSEIDPSQEDTNDMLAICELLTKSTTLVIGRDVQEIANRFVQSASLCEKQSATSVTNNIEGARLFHEIYLLLGQNNAEAT